MSNTLHLHVCPKYEAADLAVQAADAAYKAAQADESHADSQLAYWRERLTNPELAVRGGLEPKAVRDNVAAAEIAAQDAASAAVKARLALADAQSARHSCLESAEQTLAVIAQKRLDEIVKRRNTAREALTQAEAEEAALRRDFTNAIYGANGGARTERWYLGHAA